MYLSYELAFFLLDMFSNLSTLSVISSFNYAVESIWKSC